MHFQRLAAIVLVPALVLAACGPPQRIYSFQPVDRYGQQLPLEHAVSLSFESGESVTLLPGAVLTLENGRFSATLDESVQSWEASQVQQMSWIEPDSDGSVRTIDILTPDDLRDVNPLPRVYRIDLVDGRRIDLVHSKQKPGWSIDGLSLHLVKADGSRETHALADIQTIILYDASLVDSTVKSPAFWAATAAAGILYWFVSDDANDRDNATK